MKKVSLIFLVVIGSIAPFLFACGKKDKQSSRQVCRINRISAASGSPIDILYNADGKISSKTAGIIKETFQYNGNIVTITKTESDSVVSKTIVTVNDDGMATEVKTEFSGGTLQTEIFEYNGKELTKSIRFISGRGVPFIRVWSWANGNMATSSELNNQTVSFDYYTDNPVQPGDGLELEEMLLGYNIYSCKNLVKSQASSPSNIFFYTYDFDSDGKITKITENKGMAGTKIYTLEYQCE